MKKTLFLLLALMILSGAKAQESSYEPETSKAYSNQSNGSFTFDGEAYSLENVMMAPSDEGGMFLLLSNLGSNLEKDEIRQIFVGLKGAEENADIQCFNYSDLPDNPEKYFNFAECAFFGGESETTLNGVRSGNLCLRKEGNGLWRISFDFQFEEDEISGTYDGPVKTFETGDSFAAYYLNLLMEICDFSFEDGENSGVCETGAGALSIGKQKHALQYASLQQGYSGKVLEFRDYNGNCDCLSQFFLQLEIANFEEGTFSYRPYYDKDYDPKKHFCNASLADYSSYDFHAVEKGKLKIKAVSSGVYNFTFNFTTESGKKIKGSFRGSFDLLYIEHTVMIKNK